MYSIDINVVKWQAIKIYVLGSFSVRVKSELFTVEKLDCFWFTGIIFCERRYIFCNTSQNHFKQMTLQFCNFGANQIYFHSIASSAQKVRLGIEKVRFESCLSEAFACAVAHCEFSPCDLSQPYFWAMIRIKFHICKGNQRRPAPKRTSNFYKSIYVF